MRRRLDAIAHIRSLNRLHRRGVSGGHSETEKVKDCSETTVTVKS